MDHVKQLELEMLLKFEEVGGTISYADFDKVFPNSTGMWRAIYEGLDKDGYCSVGQYSMQNNVVGRAYGIEPKGGVRIIQLQKEQNEEEVAKHENKEVSGL